MRGIASRGLGMRVGRFEWVGGEGDDGSEGPRWAIVGGRVMLSISSVGIVFLGEREGAWSRPRVEYRW